MQFYNDPSNAIGVGVLGAQKAGPIPLGDECGRPIPPAGSTTGPCPENGLNTNDDGFFQVSQAQNQLWGAVDTAINQTYSSGATEQHAGAAYWVVGTSSFDKSGVFSLTSQGYVSAKHEDLEFPAMAAEGFPWQDGGNGGAIMDFTLSGNGGPTGADNGGFFPSTAFGRLSSTSGGLLGSIHVADLGQSPQMASLSTMGYPGRHPAALGRLQLGDLRALDGRQDRLRHELHPVPELHRVGVHADHRDLRRNPGWFRQLGNISQLRSAVEIRSALEM